MGRGRWNENKASFSYQSDMYRCQESLGASQSKVSGSKICFVHMLPSNLQCRRRATGPLVFDV